MPVDSRNVAHGVQTSGIRGAAGPFGDFGGLSSARYIKAFCLVREDHRKLVTGAEL